MQTPWRYADITDTCFKEYTMLSKLQNIYSSYKRKSLAKWPVSEDSVASVFLFLIQDAVHKRI